MKNPTLHNLPDDTETYDYLVRRVGKAHLRQRLGVEIGHEADRFGQGQTFLNIENWRLTARLLGLGLRLTGLAGRGRANVVNFAVRENRLLLPNLPEAFEGYTLLHLSDLHFDSLPEFPERLAQRVSGLEYDLCVLTGDYRFLTYGPHEAAMQGLARLCEVLQRDVYAVLGNHDSIVMARPIEALGVQLLMNESVPLKRGNSTVYLAGIDDPHYFAADNLAQAYEGIPDETVSILLAHSPEIYRRAAYVGFDVMLCGHTHGGQIRLPGTPALTYNSAAPRYTGEGDWTFDLMQGYTSAGTGSSIFPARFNCPPEITLHRLTRGPSEQSQ
jgi:predicted MPP superfamily phosphohydrolase